ncbi:integrase catalytic domain-containing protein [Nephila pilipes]|uniref:Integrase catalytic domain-containing protein n=1 Tax=Nephila pilipes TaxID=299642 RepID=A0A8X6PXA7_NEPPI|nr:integrase catalytic domain-containing protein [Nephila pilipes]
MSWPSSELSIPEEAFLERRKTVVTNLITENEKFSERFLYFSSYKRIFRLTTYVLRFCNNIKANSKKLIDEILCEEIARIENTLIKIIQSEWPAEIHNIESVATVRVANGEIMRPLQKIYSLELSSADNHIEVPQKAETIPETVSSDIEVLEDVKVELNSSIKNSKQSPSRAYKTHGLMNCF